MTDYMTHDARSSFRKSEREIHINIDVPMHRFKAPIALSADCQGVCGSFELQLQETLWTEEAQRWWGPRHWGRTMFKDSIGITPEFKVRVSGKRKVKISPPTMFEDHRRITPE